MIKTALDGKNITVMAYGQTSSGKTHTMQGEMKNPGIISKKILVTNYSFNNPIIISFFKILEEKARTWSKLLR